MEPIVTIVGFLGAGKTTLLKHLAVTLQNDGWDPYVILNDYADAELDAQQLAESLSTGTVRALTGSCICCDGIDELRSSVNAIPPRDKGITLIEANGTSDACTLMGFLGVGLDDRFLPPVQVSVVDVKNWQNRGYLNDLEAEQVAVVVEFAQVEQPPLGAGLDDGDRDVGGRFRGGNGDFSVRFDGSGRWFFENVGGGLFKDVSVSLGDYFQEEHVGRGACIGDYDNDGDLDIFIVNLNSGSTFLRNNKGNENNWLIVDLIGSRSNRDGVGASLRLVTDEEVQITQKKSTSGYLSQSDPRIHFGLADNTEVTTLEIVWPSGIKQVLEGISANQILEVREPEE